MSKNKIVTFVGLGIGILGVTAGGIIAYSHYELGTAILGTSGLVGIIIMGVAGFKDWGEG
jgi:hypothetical protein